MPQLWTLTLTKETLIITFTSLITALMYFIQSPEECIGGINVVCRIRRCTPYICHLFSTHKIWGSTLLHIKFMILSPKCTISPPIMICFLIEWTIFAFTLTFLHITEVFSTDNVRSKCNTYKKVLFKKNSTAFAWSTLCYEYFPGRVWWCPAL